MTKIPSSTHKLTFRLVFAENDEGSRNANRYYIMNPVENGQFRCDYGRIGTTRFDKSTTYDETMWGCVYANRLRHGYTLVSCVDEGETEEFVEPQVQKKVKPSGLLSRLKEFTKGFFYRNYSVRVQEITQDMVDRGWLLLKELEDLTDVRDFNNTLCKLFAVIPREMYDVSSFIARCNGDFKNIIERERGNLETVTIVTAPKEEAFKYDEDVENNPNIVIEKTSDEELETIKKLMGSEFSNLRNVWKVTNKKTASKFKTYTQGKSNIRLLFHGSRSENFYSIITNGMMINPSVANGRMFGNGVYFSPHFQKSKNYSSVSGSYWAHGSDSTGFVAVYDVCLGREYHTNVADDKYNEPDFLKKYDSYYCERGVSLYNDEAIIYNADGCNIRYLLEVA